MSTAAHVTTADELLHMPSDGYRYALVEGELKKMSPGGTEHGVLVFEFQGRLWNFLRDRRLGIATGAETGFLVHRARFPMPCWRHFCRA
jgi:Uma2 family endonuclease